MAEIRKRKNNYLIVVLVGIDNKGKKIRKSVTFTPTKKKESAIKKEVQEFAITFENECKKGIAPPKREYEIHWLFKTLSGKLL